MSTLYECAYCVQIRSDFQANHCYTFKTIDLSFVLVNGNSKIIDIKNQELQDVSTWLDHLKGESGSKIEKIRKYWHTDNPSIQGTWNPFMNKPFSNLKK